MENCYAHVPWAKLWMRDGLGCKMRPLWYVQRRSSPIVLRVIHRADYQRILVQEAKDLGATIRLGCNVQAVDFDLGSLALVSGEVIAGDVIIGADGKWITS